MKNRLIGTICAAVMLLALFAPMAMADGVCGESVSWTLTDDGVLTVFGEGEMTTLPPVKRRGMPSAALCGSLLSKTA